MPLQRVEYRGIKQVSGVKCAVFALYHGGETITAESLYGTRYTIDLSHHGSPYTMGFQLLPKRAGRGFVVIDNQRYDI